MTSVDLTVRRPLVAPDPANQPPTSLQVFLKLLFLVAHVMLIILTATPATRVSFQDGIVCPTERGQFYANGHFVIKKFWQHAISDKYK
jgi:hypothetical protein